MNFEDISWEWYSRFSSNLQLEVPQPEETCTVCFKLYHTLIALKQNIDILTDHQVGIVELQMCEMTFFFTPVKYTFVYHMPQDVKLHNTLLSVLIFNLIESPWINISDLVEGCIG